MFDASTPISISDMRRPDLFDLLVDLGYTLAVPSHVEREELIGADVRAMIRDLADRGIIRIVSMNGRVEVYNFMTGSHKMGLGEGDAMLTCIKMRRMGEEVRCVLDEKHARTVAGRIGIGRVGLAGLLDELASAGLVTAQDAGGIAAALRRSNFYITDDLLGGLARSI